MSPGRNTHATSKTSTTGSGPGGRVELGDIRSRLHQLQGNVTDTTTKVKPYVTYAAVAGAVVVVAGAFLLGRKRGRAKVTWVEIKRK